MMLTGFILAAGFGTRLKPLTEHIPKALVPVCGRPLLERTLEFFRQSGIKRIGVNAYHFPEQMHAFKEQSAIDFELSHETEKIRGTGGGLYFARAFLSESDVFLACNVDILAQVNIPDLHKKFLSLGCIAGLVAIPLAGGGSIYYNRETKEYAGAKADPDAQGSCAEFLGMAFYKKDFLKIAQPDDFSILPVWKRARGEGRSVKIVETEAVYWKDVGAPETLAGIHFDFLEKRCSLPIPHDMIVDFVNKKAFPKRYSTNEISRLGTNVWCEAENIPRGVSIENAVVFKNAVVTPGELLRNTIITPWGKIPFC